MIKYLINKFLIYRQAYFKKINKKYYLVSWNVYSLIFIKKDFKF